MNQPMSPAVRELYEAYRTRGLSEDLAYDAACGGWQGRRALFNLEYEADRKRMQEAFTLPRRTWLGPGGVAESRANEPKGRWGQSVRPELTEAGRLQEADLEVRSAAAFGRQPAQWATNLLSQASRGRQLLESRGTAVATVREAGGAAAVSGGRMRVKIIAPGRGSCGYYSPEVLKRDGPKVFTAGLQSFLDHPTQSERFERPERSVRDLAGRLATSAVWEDRGPLGPGLYADVEVFPQFNDLLTAVASTIGVSIRAYGESEVMAGPDGVYGPVITELSGAESVDFVTRAGAGGAIVGRA